jgi:hypothetical protein
MLSCTGRADGELHHQTARSLMLRTCPNWQGAKGRLPGIDPSPAAAPERHNPPAHRSPRTSTDPRSEAFRSGCTRSDRLWRTRALTGPRVQTARASAPPEATRTLNRSLLAHMDDHQAHWCRLLPHWRTLGRHMQLCASRQTTVGRHRAHALTGMRRRWRATIATCASNQRRHLFSQQIQPVPPQTLTQNWHTEGTSAKSGIFF